jgi:hypothetical protein
MGQLVIPNSDGKDSLAGQITITIRSHDGYRLEVTEPVEGVDYTNFDDYASTLKSMTARLLRMLQPAPPAGWHTSGNA